MKSLIYFLLLIGVAPQVMAQEQGLKKTKMVFGLSAPELLHAGLTHRWADISLIGINAGLGPTMGGFWPALSAEHRLYFGKGSSGRLPTWFFRQGVTFFPSGRTPQRTTLNLTFGKDLAFKNRRNGITIDAGVF